MTNVDSVNSDDLPWRKSRYCNGGSCVRVAPFQGSIFMGDTKSPGGPVLPFAKSEWNAFIGQVKRGDFDRF
ncbi:MAG: DUF397 domain-containing protein [Actinomycetota bacterium]